LKILLSTYHQEFFTPILYFHKNKVVVGSEYVRYQGRRVCLPFWFLQNIVSSMTILGLE
jgi:hypothetical protein